jgi:glutathione peroxidase-family protein
MKLGGGMASRQQYYAIKASLTKSEKELINFYEIQWFLRKHVPTIEELAIHLKLSQVTVNYYLQRKLVIKALDDRGIPWKQHSQDELTATQVAAAVTMMNFADDRPAAVKLDELGINASQYYAWLNDPQFKNLVDTLTEQNKVNIRPAAIAEFTKKVQSGDWNAVKYFLEVTGEYSNNDAPQSEQMIRMLVEIIQRHVKDPNVMMAIAQDFKLASANRTLEVVTTPREITSEVSVTEDLELDLAKKQLGIT